MEHFAWPLSVCGMIVILGLALLYQHRGAIGRLIDRIKSIGKGGVDATGASSLATKQAETKEIVPQPSAAGKLLKDFDNQLLLEQEALITKFLSEENVTDPVEREQVLTRYLAGSYLIIRFDSAFRSIFGTQLRALEMLNSSEPEGLPFAAVEAWYEVGKATYPVMYKDGAYTFEDWLGFMHRMVLVKTVNTHLHITVFGREFLKYLLDMGRNIADVLG